MWNHLVNLKSFILNFKNTVENQGCGVVRSWIFLGVVWFLTTPGVEVGFLSHLDVQLDHFLHHTPKLGIPVEMVISFETFVETDLLLCTMSCIDFDSQISFPSS